MNKNGLFKYCNRISNATLSVALCVFIAYNIAPAGASVVQRTTPAATTATTPRPASARMPTMTAKLATVGTGTTTTTTTNNNNNDSGSTNNTDTQPSTTTVTDDTNVQDVNQIIEDKTSQFDSVLNTASTGGTDASTQSLADMIRAQRAALDAATSEEFSQNKTNVVTAGLSACDSGLRACMKEKCGADFLKCAGDGDTIWGDKMDLCRRNVTCSGEEYRLFTTEIKADRDMNFRMSRYQAVIDCGNSYNACIEEQCGATFNKCLGKKAGDAAIAKCASIARDCTQQDSGLAARAMNVFATLRQDAEKQIKRDEQRLYELRDTMRNRCQRLGALFDERSLDCVFTVEFWAGGSPSTLYASKKAYAGSTFDCTQNWFGVDITTFKENAYRETRAQTSATSALLGSGLGIAVGSVTSGAIDRAIDRHKAEQAVKKAEKEDADAKKARDQGDDTDEATESQKGQEQPQTDPQDKENKTNQQNSSQSGTPQTQSGDSGSSSGNQAGSSAVNGVSSSGSGSTSSGGTGGASSGNGGASGGNGAGNTGSNNMAVTITNTELNRLFAQHRQACQNYNNNGISGKFEIDYTQQQYGAHTAYIAHCYLMKNNQKLTINAAETSKILVGDVCSYNIYGGNRPNRNAEIIFPAWIETNNIKYHGFDPSIDYAACLFTLYTD